MPVLSYPADLGTTPSLQNYVMFYINARVGSPGVTGATGTPTVRRIPGVDPGAAIVAGTRGAAATGGVLGLAPTPELLGAAVTRRLDTAIALHVNTAPMASYAADYSDVSFNFFGDVSNVMEGKSSLKELAQAFGARVAGNLGALPMNQISAANKVRLNPFKQQYFRHMQFRAFRFDYTFFPKSPAESEAIRNIIYQFKYHMHPNLAGGGSFFIYPSEFDIIYHYGGAENGYMHKIATSVLNKVDIIYGSSENNIKFATFPGGKPVEVQLRLHFTEIETLTKEAISEGF